MKLKTFVSALAFTLCLGLAACGGDEPDAPDNPATTPSDKPSGGSSGGGSNDSDDSQYLASGKCGANITWTLDEYGTLRLSGKGKMNDYSASSAPWSKWSEKVIKRVSIANGITSIGDCAFSVCFKLSSVSIPNSVTTIGKCAFWCCTELKNVELPNSVKSIGVSAFEGCGFSSITISSGVTIIEERTFLACEKLSSVTIPNGVTSIDKCAFAHCYRLSNVTIPSSVTAIGDGAFYECDKLNQVTCMATNPPTCYSNTYLNYGSFDDLSYIIRHLKVPSSAVSKYKSAAVWKKFKSITGI